MLLQLCSVSLRINATVSERSRVRGEQLMTTPPKKEPIHGCQHDEAVGRNPQTPQLCDALILQNISYHLELKGIRKDPPHGPG